MLDVDDWRIDHTGIGVSNIGRSTKFYDAALGALGLRAVARITKTFEIADSLPAVAMIRSSSTSVTKDGMWGSTTLIRER